MFDVGEQRGLERSIGELVHPQRPKQRVRAHALDEVGAAAEQSSLRSAEQLIAAVGDEIHPGAKAVEHGRFVVNPEALKINERAAPQILDEGKIPAMPKLYPLRGRRLFGESRDFEIRAMHS